MKAEEKIQILIVEDEENIREGISDVLAYHGYAPSAVATGDEGLEQAMTGDFAVVILDVMLPGLNGFDICRRVRRGLPRQLILMLTAKGSEDDVVEGFRCGADDYVTKPFSIRELIARIEALLRRSGELDRAREVFKFGRWDIDRANLLARADGHTREMTIREVDLLSILLREISSLSLIPMLLVISCEGFLANLLARSFVTLVRLERTVRPLEITPFFSISSYPSRMP